MWRVNSHGAINSDTGEQIFWFIDTPNSPHMPNFVCIAASKGKGYKVFSRVFRDTDKPQRIVKILARALNRNDERAVCKIAKYLNGV